MRLPSFQKNILLICLTILGLCVLSAHAADPFAANERLGRGINLGNALDAPKGQDWGLTIQKEHFPIIKNAGFDSVRIPIRWSDYALKSPPYTIDPAFFAKVDGILADAKANGLNAIINVHHYEEIMQDPEAHYERLLAMWEQIATHYQDYGDWLFFELLNEPFDALDVNRWNTLIPRIIDVVRKSNPERTLMVGPAGWNSVKKLYQMKLPKEERNLIVAIHYYEPFKFTTQGAHWVPQDTKSWIGTTWKGTEEEQADLEKDFEKMATYIERAKRPIAIGEFGAIYHADMDSRARWVAAVREQAEKHGMSWTYWEFGTEIYGAYDQKTGQWRKPLLEALTPAQ